MCLSAMILPAPFAHADAPAMIRNLPNSSAAPTATPVANMLRMNMKSYGNHDELSYSDTLGDVPYDQRILSIKPEFVIDNPPHGLYGEMEEQKYPGEGYRSAWLLQNIIAYQIAGIKIIGYISSGYEGKGGDDQYTSKWYSLEMNEKLITNMATIDHVNGVFIDECSDYPNAASKSYLTELSDLAHSYGMIVWMNTGVDDFDEWYFTVADFVQSSEDWAGQGLSPVQQKWGAKIGVTGFKASYTAQDAYNLTIDAWNKGIAYCYINTVEYTGIAPWFEEYARMLSNWNGCPTPTGSAITVSLPGVIITFSDVTRAGNTSCTLSLTNPNGSLPQGIRVIGPFVDIETTASYNRPVTIGLTYDQSEPDALRLKLFHAEGDYWRDITTSADTTHHVIYGEVSSLSWFYIGGQEIRLEGLSTLTKIYIGIASASVAVILAYFVRRRLLRQE